MGTNKPPTKVLREVIEWATARGWSWSYTGHNHIRFTRPGCPPVHTAGSPSSPHAATAMKRDIVRAERAACARAPDDPN